MLDKVIDWLTEVVTGDDSISRAFVIGIVVIILSLTLYIFTKDRDNINKIPIGSAEEQIKPIDL